MAEKKKAAPKAAKEKQTVAEADRTVTATVTLPPQYGALNIREEPNGKIVGTLKNGQPVKVLDTVQHNGESWAKISEKQFVNMAFLKTE